MQTIEQNYSKAGFQLPTYVFMHRMHKLDEATLFGSFFLKYISI